MGERNRKKSIAVPLIPFRFLRHSDSHVLATKEGVVTLLFPPAGHLFRGHPADPVPSSPFYSFLVLWSETLMESPLWRAWGRVWTARNGSKLSKQKRLEALVTNLCEGGEEREGEEKKDGDVDVKVVSATTPPHMYGHAEWNMKRHFKIYRFVVLLFVVAVSRFFLYPSLSLSHTCESVFYFMLVRPFNGGIFPF